MVVYLDANIFIFPVISNDVRAQKSIEILKKVILGELSAVTSTLTLDEVVWCLLKLTKDRDLAIKEGLKILRFDNLQIISVDQQIMHDSFQFMKKYASLKPRDAIHLAAALRSNATEFVSDDSDFDVVKEIKRKPL
ncbi:MAG: type II toxin-antitoxin system VapC family toxin [Nanoarchaeota archaeon]